MAAIGDMHGKWRVIDLYEIEGEQWAKVENTTNPQVTARVKVSDLEGLT